MTRALVLMLDSLGIGASIDADRFGDVGADTFGHIVEFAASGRADQQGVRSGGLTIPNLLALGLSHASNASTGKWPVNLPKIEPVGSWGYAVEKSAGKDTPSGHWEMAGVPVESEWGYFFKQEPCFPNSLISELTDQAHLPGILGNRHASGIEIIKELGAEHMATGKPIVYTSADSVFQIAAHEESFGLSRLYDTCDIARRLVDEYRIGRVIARPFDGGQSATFNRTANRRDYTTPPPHPTLLDHLVASDREVISIGKVGDIFANRGVTRKIKANGNDELFDATVKTFANAPNGSLVFTNFVDFDMLYGHRRNVVGYANALERFDLQLPELISLLGEGDLVIVTADHGCDPTWPGHDHTREHVPVLAFGPNVIPGSLGQRETFADIGQTLAEHLEVGRLSNGTSFYSSLMSVR
ncbi:MAG: phosphopentomutase [Acidiferrobacteraceae bacterium]|nr:phosphopentomutase [Acidiferrobacteraceae bacterium]